MDYNPSQDDGSPAISSKSTILWNPYVHYHADNSPSLVSAISHINALHILQFYTSYLRVISILPPTLVSEMAPFKLLHQKHVSIYFTPNMCQISLPSTPSFCSNKNHESLRYATFSSLLLLSPSDADDDNDGKRGPAKWC